MLFQIISGSDGGHFDVNSVNVDNESSIAEIFVAKPLDFESVKSYSLTIKAYNMEANINSDPLAVRFFVYLQLWLTHISINYCTVVTFDNSSVTSTNITYTRIFCDINL